MAGLASLQARRTRHGMCRTVSLLRTDESTCVVFPFSVTYVRRWWRALLRIQTCVVASSIGFVLPSVFVPAVRLRTRLVKLERD